MNLDKLIEMQRELDNRIIEKKGFQGRDWLDKKILALQVELGELANEWRGFKFWSNNQVPRLRDYKQIKCKWCNGSGDDGTGVCPDCKSLGDVYKEYNPLLEEYVDCLHFILSIGLELGIGSKDIKVENDYRGDTPTETFNVLFSYISSLRTFIFDVTIAATIANEDIKELYHQLFECFVGLGEIDLGFTWEQIENAYLDKNKINHERQENGY